MGKNQVFLVRDAHIPASPDERNLQNTNQTFDVRLN